MSKINITRDDILPLIYFIISMFQEENNHRQGTSSKSDLLGGFIDRWVNKIPEELIFSKHLLKNKNYKVINDYFIYGAGSDKNAPDILGLKENDDVIPFAVYKDTKWEQINGMPHIEIKTFRKNQKLVSVRDTQLDDDTYYIFVESDLKQDYMLKLFDIKYFTEEIRKKLIMDDVFISSNSKGIIKSVNNIIGKDSDSIGTIEILRVLKGCEYRKRATLCDEKKNVYYLKGIEFVKDIRGKNLNTPFNEFFEYEQEINCYSSNWGNLKLIPMYVNNVDKIIIRKVNKKNFYVETLDDAQIYNFKLKSNSIYRVDLEQFERNSSWREYVALKNQFTEDVDATEELLKHFDEIVKNNLISKETNGNIHKKKEV